ncbi:MAG: hypothetical protein IJ184_07225 [Alphaproteobacteria bacterium]|nr:hypothetical protein [Alphaproteobacteria bacterium]
MSINIINRALLKIGEPLISSTAQEPNGKIYGLIYEDILKLLLCNNDWRFAIKRVCLAPDIQDPISGFAKAYTLPADFLKLYQFGLGWKLPNYRNYIALSDERYSIEGDKILCDVEDKLYISYVALVTEEKKFSPWFREAMAAKLAAEYAMRIKQSAQLAQGFENEFFQCLAQADKNNELMCDSQTIPDGSWVGVREVIDVD